MIWFVGKKGEKNRSVASYKASSGYRGPSSIGFINFQDVSYQNKEFGPVPAADYSINLQLNPDRFAGYDHQTGELYAGEGMQRIPKNIVINGIPYPQGGWGNNRARLDLVSGDVFGRHNFYFHDSEKGYTHGCVESSWQNFSLLRAYRQKYKSIDFRVRYTGTTSYGGTDQ